MRTQTNRLIDMMDEGLISSEDVATMCLMYMSESEVEDMMRSNDIIEDEDDGQPTEQEEWASFDPDC